MTACPTSRGGGLQRFLTLPDERAFLMASASTQHELFSADVPDPTDFPPPNIAPGLRLLDEALRCSICHELYDAPVTLNCGHSFCSLVSYPSLAALYGDATTSKYEQRGAL